MIRCESVEKEFVTIDQHQRVRWALADLTIERGERVIVTGPSGCGKTTLLNLLAGMLRLDSGSITVDGVRVDQLSTSEADVFRGQHLGLIFQSFQLLTPLTVLENVLLGARYGRKWHGHAACEKAENLLEQVGLSARKHYRPSQLSIGEQQRVAIARALINEPPLLLADEPTASLDAANVAIVLDLLFKLCESHGTTLVTVTHDLTAASRFDRQINAAPWMRPATQEESHV